MPTKDSIVIAGEHPYDIAVAQAVEQGVILRDPNALKLAELPPVPEDIHPKAWLAYQCIKQVVTYMMEWKIQNQYKACQETGWAYETYRASRRNADAMGLWQEEIGIAREAGLAHLRASYYDVAAAQVDLASSPGPHSTRAAQWITEELNRHEAQLEQETTRLRQGGKLSEAARLLADADTLKVVATETRQVQITSAVDG